MTTTPTTVRIDVYSDYTCPWCYVGWARLEKALGQLSHGVGVDVTWRPFEIHPEVPPEGMSVEDLPYSPDQWQQMQEALRRSAGNEGLEVGKRPLVSNTHRALVAGAYAQAEEPERFPTFHEALFKGYFAQGRDLGDPGVVADLARGSGLDVERMTDALEGGRYESELTATAEQARRLGISSTPTFVFADRYSAVGAQPADVLLRAIDAVLEESEEE